MPVTANLSADRPLAMLRWAGQALTGAVALLLLAMALRMNRDWTDRHLLPDIIVPSDWLMMIVQVERLLLVALAAVLLLAMRRIGARRGIAIAMAVLLALPASELVMQYASGRKGQAWNPSDEPLRRADPLIGWTYTPSRCAGDPEYAWRPVYCIDGQGYRVASSDMPFDRAAPAILFVGESILFGKGLNWRDSVAGQVQELSGIASANLAVNAYSLSQGFLHLKRELPRFRHPVAVVILFTPSLMMRELDRNRPWIDSAGHWHRATGTWALSHLGRVLFPYHGAAAIDEAVAADRRLLRAEVALVRARGARPLVLVPVFQPEGPRERALRAAIFNGAAIPHLVVPLGQHWRLPDDSHPDARAHRMMARALWTRLRTETS